MEARAGTRPALASKAKREERRPGPAADRLLGEALCPVRAFQAGTQRVGAGVSRLSACCPTSLPSPGPRFSG